MKFQTDTFQHAYTLVEEGRLRVIDVSQRRDVASYTVKEVVSWAELVDGVVRVVHRVESRWGDGLEREYLAIEKVMSRLDDEFSASHETLHDLLSLAFQRNPGLLDDAESASEKANRLLGAITPKANDDPNSEDKE